MSKGNDFVGLESGKCIWMERHILPRTVAQWDSTITNQLKREHGIGGWTDDL
jgi:hypothetical protein